MNETAPISTDRRRRVAFYGGSFDPVHRGHLAIGFALLEQFKLDEFVFLPAFHAPHKKRNKPTSAYDRYAMLCLVTENEPHITVSKMEIEMPERQYSVETLATLNTELPDTDIFFIMGADSWMDIMTWREWEKVLSMTNHIVVTRPGYLVTNEHVTDEIRSRIVDFRKDIPAKPQSCRDEKAETRSVENALSTGERRSIFLTDAVNFDISATEIRQKIRDCDASWHNDVPVEVANYIEKYQIYN